MLETIEDTFDETLDATTDFAADLATGAAAALHSMGSGKSEKTWVSTVVKIVLAMIVIGAIAAAVRQLLGGNGDEAKA